MTIPDMVKIGPVEYAVKENQRFSQDNLLGQIRYAEQTIEIRPDLASTIAEITLWHEMIHGILFAGGFHDHDEQMLDVLAHGVVQLLKDNSFLKGNA